MAVAVREVTNRDQQIVDAAKVVGTSKRRQAVFRAIYFGPKQSKSAKEIAQTTGLSEWDVLTVGRKLLRNHLAEQDKKDGGMAYKKVSFCTDNKDKILEYATKPQKLKKVATRSSPKVINNISVKQQGVRIRVSQITCDDLNELKGAKRVKVALPRTIPEKTFKYGIAKLAKQSGKFTDWGGEKNDLYTSKIHLKGKRKALAFAFKGPATKGKLTPAKLGKNGDQIQRLFGSAADVFMVQYHGEIDESVIHQMKLFAIAASVTENKQIWYGVIDGDDTKRILSAYPSAFGIKK